MTPTTSVDLDQYEAAKSATVVFDTSHYGLIRMVGKDALDLLHRLSTQDLAPLRPGEGAETILTTEKGRILDTVLLLRRADDLMLQVSPTNQARVLTWLNKYTIMEDSAATDVTDEHGQLLVLGAEASTMISKLIPSVTHLPLYHHVDAEVAGASVVVSRTRAPVGDGFHLVAHAGDLGPVRAVIARAGVTPIEASAFDVLRIEAGQPEFGSELDERFNPHEANLARHISYTKGCYIGQEVIARLDTYDKVQRHLRGLRVQGDASVTPGSQLLRDGKEVGLVTSVATSPAFGQIALAYVRRACAETGTRLIANPAIEVEVVGLPFA